MFHVQNIPHLRSERIADKRRYRALIQLRAVNISCYARKTRFSARASFSEIIARAATTGIVNGQSQTMGASCRCLTFTSMLTHRLSLIGKADKYGRAKDIQSLSGRYARFIYGVNFSARCGTRWTFWNANGLARRKLYFTSASGHVHKLSRLSLSPSCDVDTSYQFVSAFSLFLIVFPVWICIILRTRCPRNEFVFLTGNRQFTTCIRFLR